MSIAGISLGTNDPAVARRRGRLLQTEAVLTRQMQTAFRCDRKAEGYRLMGLLQSAKAKRRRSDKRRRARLAEVAS